MELVAYNSDGTLPTNQVYDDIVTDVNITAPAIVDINNNNHAEIKYTSVDKGYVGLPNISQIITNTNSIPISPTEILNVGVGSSGGEHNTYVWIFDHKAAQNKRYVNITGYKATRAIDISEYLDNTILLMGTTTYDGPITYAFLNVETLQYTSLRTISGVSIEQEAVPYHESNIYYDNSIYIINHNTKSALNAHKFTLAGHDFNSLSLSYSSVTTFTGKATYHLGKQLTESGNSNKVAFIGIKYSSTALTKFWYYTILTLGETPSFSNEVYVNQTSVESSEYRYSEALIKDTVNIDFLTVSKEYCFCTCTSAANSNETDRNRSPLLVRFTYNDNSNTLSLTTTMLSNTSWYSKVTLRSAEDNKYIYVYYINTVSTNYSTPMLLLVIDKNTLQTVGNLNSSITATSNLKQIHYMSTIEYNRCRTNIINGTHIVLTYIPGTTNKSGATACAVMCNYDDNGTMKLGFYPNNTSTKALAVTSGNIGDTVRIAYEGTYRVPGVPTGSIYNTDTSYAIAKKSGVLTVSEPQQTSKVYYGSYVGDGVSGKTEDKPMSITFPFEPTLIWMFGSSNTKQPAKIWSVDDSNSNVSTKVDITKVTESFTNNGAWAINGTESVYHKVSSDRKTYYWYDSARSQLSYNTLNITYYFIAFG